MSKNFFRRLSKKFFIIANVTVGVLFLLGCYARWFNPANWWPIGLLTLACFYFLLLLVLFIIFWMFAKPRFSLISIITILLAFNPVTRIIPLRLATAFNKEKTDSVLRMMSWNVEHFDILEYKTHPEVKEQMLALINDYQPDVACFQEMVGADSNSKTINYVPEIAARLQYPYSFYSYNPKLDFGWGHHFGILTFSKYPIINKKTISFLPNDYNSIFQYVDILKGNDTIRVFNIHLQSLKFSSTNLKYLDKPSLNDQDDIKRSKGIISKLKTGFVKRGVQADRIRAEIDNSPYPVIVCGDFNDVPNSYAYNRIGGNLQNAFEERGSGLGRTFSSISPTLRIDNIFADKRMAVRQYTRVKKKLSDHFPVLADIDLSNK